MFKMMRIHSTLANLNWHFAQSVKQGKAVGVEGELWQVVMPIMNPPESVHFETDEMVMLFGLKDFALFNEIAGLDDRHNGTIKAISVYAEKRVELTSRLPSAMTGRVGSSALTETDLMMVRPRMVELNTLIESVKNQCAVQENDAWRSLERLQSLLASKIGLKITLERLNEDALNAKRQSGSAQ